MLPSILKNIVKLFFIVLGLSISSISANIERIDNLIFSLENRAQRLTLTVQDLTHIMVQIFNDEAFAQTESHNLITALQFALSSAFNLDDSELITQIQHYLRQLGAEQNLTPPMTQYD